ncbi:MAG: phenylacetate--CoA ligase family protein [Oscillospiraceae bacterium]|nr:phenylacetate--CoA ligase family protein [Oscillospiraceae bacterium]
MTFTNLVLKLAAAKLNAKLPRSVIRKMQQKRLREMLIYAYDHSPYYRKAFNAAGINRLNISDAPIESFPTMDKQTLLENFDRIVTIRNLTQEKLRSFDSSENVDQKTLGGKFHLIHSSGSTGKPGYFLYDNNAWDTMLIGIIRAALWDMSMLDIFRLKLSKPKILYIAAADGRYAGAMAVGDGLDDLGFEKLVLDVQTPLDELQRKLRQFKPDIIIGYPTAIKMLVQTADYKFNIQRVITCGEPLSANLRKYFKKYFKCRILNFYGASESIAIGVEDDTSGGMYLFDDMNYIEISDGGIYLTCLYNFAQPLIRYKISDKSEKMPYDNKCPFSKIKNILGRSEDIMWFKNAEGKDEFLHPLSIEGLCVNGLLDYQFVQKSDKYFEINAQLRYGADSSKILKALDGYMRKILKLNGLSNISFNIHIVNEINADKQTGKKRLVVCERLSA